MRSFNFAVKARGMRFDIDMPDPKVLNMPVEASLKLMTIVDSHSMDPKGQPFNDVVDELDCGIPIVRGIDL